MLRNTSLPRLAFPLLLSAALVLPGSAHAESDASSVIGRYIFDGRGSGSLLVIGSVRVGPGALFATAILNLTDRRNVQAVSPQVIDLGEAGGLRTYGAAGDRQYCGGPLSCNVHGNTFTFRLAYDIQGDGKERIRIRQYIAVRGRDIRIRLVRHRGWTSGHRVGGLTIASDNQARGAGVGLVGLDSGLEEGVRVEGPAAGSLAIAVPNCDIAGVGEYSLYGGTQPSTARCPIDAISDFTPHRTIWTTAGVILGIGSNQSRLVVITQ